MDGQIGYKMPISWPRTTTRRVVLGRSHRRLRDNSLAEGAPWDA